MPYGSTKNVFNGVIVLVLLLLNSNKAFASVLPLSQRHTALGCGQLHSRGKGEEYNNTVIRQD